MVAVTSWWKGLTEPHAHVLLPAVGRGRLPGRPLPRLALSPPSNQRKIMQNIPLKWAVVGDTGKETVQKTKVNKNWKYLALPPSLFFPGFSCWLWKWNLQKIQEEVKKQSWYVVLNFILNACKGLSTRWCHSKGRALKEFQVSLCDSNRSSAV